jgi:hypothetical protein
VDERLYGLQDANWNMSAVGGGGAQEQTPRRTPNVGKPWREALARFGEGE